MFLRHFFAGRYFPPRYWPGAIPSPSVPAPLVLVLFLSHPTFETLNMAVSRSSNLRLTFDPIAELTLRRTNTVSLKLIAAPPVPLFLSASDPILLILEE